MADKSNSNLSSSSNNDDNISHRRLKQAFTTGDKGRTWKSSGTSRQSVAAGLQDLAESMLKRQVAELDMMKRREAVRIEAENQRVKRETEMMEMMLKTQLQLASFICSQTCDRKRKRGEDDGGESPASVDV